MSLSNELMVGWRGFVTEVVGRHIPPNAVSYKGEEGSLHYTVPDGDPPLVCKNGQAVRELSYAYDIEEIQNEQRQ